MIRSWKPRAWLIACAITLLSSAVSAQYDRHNQVDRLLASGDDYRMTLREARCERIMNIDIQLSSQASLRPDGERLRRILAVARAILTYECPVFDGLQVHGHDESSGLTRLSGRALAKNNWEFVSHYYEEDRPVSQPEPLDTSEQFSIANLHVGMRLDDAHSAMGQLYDNVRYRERRRMLVAGTEGCGSRRARLDARMNAKNQHCMRVWFSEGRVPLVEKLMLVQRVEGDQRREGIRTLRQRFGRPVARTYHDPSRQHAKAGFGEISRLRWGVQVATPEDGKGSHELEADVASNDHSTELILRLQGRPRADDAQTRDNPFVY